MKQLWWPLLARAEAEEIAVASIYELCSPMPSSTPWAVSPAVPTALFRMGQACPSGQGETQARVVMAGQDVSQAGTPAPTLATALTDR